MELEDMLVGGDKNGMKEEVDERGGGGVSLL